MNPKVVAIFESFPNDVQQRLMEIRDVIFSVQSELNEMDRVEETVKWGEPSYTTLGGSTVRLGWKSATPDTIFIYFHCQTKLVATFRELYSDHLQFEGNRAMVLPMEGPIPQEIIRQCILIALTYHKRKHLPLLGAVVEEM